MIWKKKKTIPAQESSSKQCTNNLSTHFMFLENFMRLCIHKRKVVIPIYTVNWLYRFISMLSLHFADICIKQKFFNPPRTERSRIDTSLLYVLHIHYFKMLYISKSLNFRGKCIASCTTITHICYLVHNHIVWTTAKRSLINVLIAGPRSLSVKAQTFRPFRKKLAYNLLISNVANIVRAILFPLVCLLVNEQ